MNTLPGGRLALPPPVSRVAAGGAAFLLAAVMCAIWGGASTLGRLTTRFESTVILRQALTGPYTDELQRQLAASKAGQLTVDHDLVQFDINRTAAENPGLPRLLAEARANELYDKGFPKNPGVGHTQAALPRVVLSLFTQEHHRNLKPAQTAGLVGMGTALLLCAVIATGAARFALPGAALFLGRIILTWHERLVNFWVEKDSPGALLFRGRLRLAMAQPSRQLAFLAITLLVAGAVYSALRGGTKQAVAERKQRKAARVQAAADRKAAKAAKRANKKRATAGPGPTQDPALETAAEASD